MIDPKLSREDSMTVKDILAIVDTGDEDEQFLKDAREFARFHDAHLTVAILSAVPPPDYAIANAQPYFLLRSEEHTSELQSLMRISYAVFCLIKQPVPPSLKIPQLNFNNLLNNTTT